MPQNAVVIVRYGPYKSCGIVDHRTFRLIGLQAALKENGHQSVLEKMSDWNKVELVVNGECVYTCNIKQLEFGKFNVDTVDYSIKLYRILPVVNYDMYRFHRVR
uniref:Chromosome 10 open reading frame 53 n=1 Tax=Hucho hucho TaxID=62062 RepID=A0A4W5RDH9_9TELE